MNTSKYFNFSLKCTSVLIKKKIVTFFIASAQTDLLLIIRIIFNVDKFNMKLELETPKRKFPY